MVVTPNNNNMKCWKVISHTVGPIYCPSALVLWYVLRSIDIVVPCRVIHYIQHKQEQERHIPYMYQHVLRIHIHVLHAKLFVGQLLLR